MSKPKNISELFHRYANGYRDNCRVGNVSIQGGRIYSYNLEICDEIKGTYILHYSDSTATTNGHIAELRSALSHQKVTHVPNVENVGRSHAQLYDMISAMLKEASTARTRKESILAELAGKLDDFNQFAALKGSEFHFDIAEVISRNMNEIAAAKKEEQKKLLAQKKDRLEWERAGREQQLEKWRAGSSTYGRSLRDLPCALRLRPGDGASQLSDNLCLVETSHGASITVEEAKTLWKVIQRAMKKHDDPAKRGIKVGNYTLTKIKENGDVVIGCHDISYSEMEGIAKQLELV